MTSETQAAPPPNPKLAKRRRIAVSIACAIFGLCGLAYLIYWIGWGRFTEWTDDAYVNGNMIMLTPQVGGIVTTILSDNTQLVEQGQPIVLIDKHDYEIALEKARADLGKAVRDTVQLFVKVGELEAALDARKADLIRGKLDYEHRNALLASGGVSKEDFEHSETTLFAAFGRMMETQAKLEAAYAEVQGTTVPTHPKVMQAKASLKRAFLDLHRCTVLSPVKGIVTQRKIQVGQWVKSQDPLLAIVPLDQIWVDANYREVQLENLRIGQPVMLRAEMYGRDFDFHGNIVGLNPGTGSVFSVLPPQNATGNWIKIIQRIPVKISLDLEELQTAPLVLGLTMTVWTNTHSRDGKRLPTEAPIAPLYETAVYEQELAGVDQLIESIIGANMMKQEILGDDH
jgi:membrane fusion protein (multidrug efflux system)